MKFTKKRATYWLFGDDKYPINADDDYLCMDKYLESILLQLKRTLEHHSRIVVIRFDLTSFDYRETNSDIEELIRRVKQWARKEYRMRNIGHFWVREFDKKKNLHWHVLMMLDGNLVRNNFKFNEFISHWWTYRDLGNFSYPRVRSYHQLSRNDKEAFDECFYHCSYLAKERSKSGTGKNSCQYGASKLKPKN